MVGAVGVFFHLGRHLQRTLEVSGSRARGCNSWNGRRKVDRTDIQPDSSLERGSEYRAVLTDSDIAPTTAHRWQTVAQVRALTLQKGIYVGLSQSYELSYQIECQAFVTKL